MSEAMNPCWDRTLENIRARLGGSLATWSHSWAHRTPVPAEPAGSLGVYPNSALQTAGPGEWATEGPWPDPGCPPGPCTTGCIFSAPWSTGESSDLGVAEGPGIRSPVSSCSGQEVQLSPPASKSPCKSLSVLLGAPAWFRWNTSSQSPPRKGADEEGMSANVFSVLCLMRSWASVFIQVLAADGWLQGGFDPLAG